MVRLYEGTISAEPEKLIAYGNRAVTIDEALTAEGHKVTASLSAFEAGCTEPGFALNVAHLGGALANYGQSCITGDERVRQTGLGFLRADTLATGAVIGAVALGLSPVIVAPALHFASLLSVPSWLRAQIARLPWVHIQSSNRSLYSSIPSEMRAQQPSATMAKGNTLQESKGIENHIPHLSQINPEEDEFLYYTRYENPPGSGKPEFEGNIRTIKDHIAKYGCLMTSYTMLLRGKGYDTKVTDLYLTKVNKQGQIGEKSVTLFDLYTGPETANDYLEKKGVNSRFVKEVLTGSDNNEKIENLHQKVREVGPLILHVKGVDSDGHWIVLSGSNDEDSLTILDSLKNEPTTLDQYDLFGDDVFHYLKDTTNN
jgi:hypothetical protein